jgi:menaquinol-cytochrome c reductase cytochrome b/c subunit
VEHGQHSNEKKDFVGDSRVVKKAQRLIPRDYSAYPGKSETFIPNFLLKEWMVAVVFLTGVLLLVISKPAPLGYPADPATPGFIPMPDWYFLFLYQLLKYPYTSGDFVIFGTIVLPTLMFGALTLAPFLDTGKERVFYKRPISSALMFVSIAAVVYLTFVSWSHYQHELTAKGIIPEHIKREQEMEQAKEDAKENANSGEEQKPTGETEKDAVLVQADHPGAAIYNKATCIACHMDTLKGMPTAGIPALLGVGDKYSKDEILGIINNGIGSMGAQYEANIAKGLTDADIDVLAEWLSLQKK